MDPAAILGLRWIHAFEEDTPAGAVYRPESGDCPLSRRPRERFELEAGGAARVFVGGADDRPVARAGRWRATPRGILIELPGDHRAAGIKWLIVEATANRVVVATGGP